MRKKRGGHQVSTAESRNGENLNTAQADADAPGSAPLDKAEQLWGGVGLVWEGLVLFSLWSHLAHGKVGPFVVRLLGTHVPHLQPHAQALSDCILCEVQLSSFFEVPSPALTDVQYHFAAVIRVSLIFITMH